MAAAKKTARKTVSTAETAANDTFKTVENMSNAARDQFESLYASFAENAETFRGQAEEMAETLRGNIETAQTRLQEVNAELANAAREEAAEAVDFMNSLARARTVADALEIQRDYWTNLFQTRMERTQEFAKTSVEAARESFEPLSKSFDAFSKNSPFEKFFPFAAK